MDPKAKEPKANPQDRFSGKFEDDFEPVEGDDEDDDEGGDDK